MIVLISSSLPTVLFRFVRLLWYSPFPIDIQYVVSTIPLATFPFISNCRECVLLTCSSLVISHFDWDKFRQEKGKSWRRSIVPPSPSSSFSLRLLLLAIIYIIYRWDTVCHYSISIDRLTTLEVSLHELIAWVHARLHSLGFWPSQSRKELVPSDRGNGFPCLPMGDTNESSLWTSSLSWSDDLSSSHSSITRFNTQQTQSGTIIQIGLSDRIHWR